MSTLVTPSAKSHERITGRWVRDLDISSRRERFVYYLKQLIGTPISWLLAAYVCLMFFSRAGLELAAWSCAFLTLSYIVVDRFSRNKEFAFFRLGADFFLLGYLISAFSGAVTSASFSEGITHLGGVRWVILLYSLTYCWELFPGLNRVFFLLITSALAAAGYGIWQHFVGLDLIRDAALSVAPVLDHTYFISTGFFSRPEIFATVLAVVLPFPAAAFLMNEERFFSFGRWCTFLVVLILSLALIWTYHLGLWMAGGAGILITLLMKGRHQFLFSTLLSGAFALLLFVAYDSPETMFANVQNAELERSDRQRAQINTQVGLWQKSTWNGVGNEAQTAATYDPGTGNVYFQLLAQYGVFGATFYLLFILSFMLITYRVYQEIPPLHFWHRVLVGGGLGSQIAFHTAGLFWSTISESLVMYLFIMVLASISYVNEHYGKGLVPDDYAL